jgi:hypothetical protein
MNIGTRRAYQPATAKNGRHLLPIPPSVLLGCDSDRYGCTDSSRTVDSSLLFGKNRLTNSASAERTLKTGCGIQDHVRADPGRVQGPMVGPSQRPSQREPCRSSGSLAQVRMPLAAKMRWGTMRSCGKSRDNISARSASNCSTCCAVRAEPTPLQVRIRPRQASWLNGTSTI